MAGSASVWVLLIMVVLGMVVVVFFVQKKQAIATKLALILSIFLVLSLGYVFVSSNFSINSPSDFFDFIGVYFSWIGSFSHNVWAVTTQAINLDWGANNKTLSGT